MSGVAGEPSAPAAAAAVSSRTPPDAAMLRHSWATGGTGSSWRQQKQQQQQKQQDMATADVFADSKAQSSIEEPGATDPALLASSSSSSTGDDSNTSTSSSSSSGSSEQPAYAGVAAAGSDWAATAAKAAQLRSVIEWGLEAYGVNAAGSEPSSEVSVVIWPGGVTQRQRRTGAVLELACHHPEIVGAGCCLSASGSALQCFAVV